MRPETREVALQAADLYHEEGLTLAEVGERLGVTRERVRQLLRDVGRPSGPCGYTNPAVLRRRAASRVAVLDEHREEALAMYREGGGVRRIWKAYASDGATFEATGEWIAANLTPQEREDLRRAAVARRKAIEAVPDERLTEDLREAAAELGPDLTHEDFAAWARKRGRRGSQTHIHRFGSWNESRLLAGLPAVNSNKALRPDRISEEECREAVRLVAVTLGRAPAAQEYLREAKARRLPSLATVRWRLGEGKWAPARAIAEELLLGEPAVDENGGLPVAHPEAAE